MKNKTCCFTGHRKTIGMDANEYNIIRLRLENIIEDLVLQGVCDFLSGGALGFDLMAAMAVIKLKDLYPHIRLIMALPCSDQDKLWRPDDQKIYNHILGDADAIVYSSDGKYYDGCMQKRNRYLVDHSGICVCYMTRSNGGTAYTVNYAKQKGLRIINVALNSLIH